MAGLQQTPSSLLTQLAANLRDHYGRGFPILKELVQNADDAGATRLALAILPGWNDVASPLLQWPGLLVANDGPFEKAHADGLKSFGSTSKAGDVGSVGRFGFGQKSVFHLCDAFIFTGRRGASPELAEVVNPYDALMDPKQRDAWERIHPEGIERLHEAADRIGFNEQRFLLWLPLRRKPELEPLPDAALWQHWPMPDSLCAELRHPVEIAALLTLLRHLNRVEIWSGANCVLTVAAADRATRLLGAAKPGLEKAPRRFGGTFLADGNDTFAVGLEWQPRIARLDEIQQNQAWPRTPPELGRSSPEKAMPHGAVVVVRQPRGADKLRIRWAVFLPTDSSGDEVLRLPPGSGSVHIFLHGYFFLDSGRKGIPWPGPSDSPANGTEISRAWNATLRDAVTLPLLPVALLDAHKSGMLSAEQLEATVRALGLSGLFGECAAAICAQRGLARILLDDGTVAWAEVPAQATSLPLPASATDGRQVLRLLPGLHRTGRLIVVDPTAALLPSPPRWSPAVLAEVLAEANREALSNIILTRLLADTLEAASLDHTGRASIANVLINLFQHALAAQRADSNAKRPGIPI